MLSPYHPPSPGSSEADQVRPLRLLLVASLVLPAIVLACGTWLSWQHQQAAAEVELRRVTEVMQEHAAKAFETQVLVATAVDAILGDLDDAAIRAQEPLFNRRLQAFRALPQVQDVVVVSHDGRPLVSAAVYPVPRVVDFADRPDFRRLRDGEGAVISTVQRGRLEDSVAFQYSYRRRGPGGFAGAVLVSVSPNVLRDYYGRFAAPGQGFEAMLLREDGAILARYPYGAGLALNGNSPVLARLQPGQAVALFDLASELDRVPRLMAVRRVPDLPLLVAAGISHAEVVRRWSNSLLVLFGVGLPVMAVMFFLSLVALRRARREAAAMAEAASESMLREAAEHRLVRAQRLEALGQLTGGVAHDFNNLLQVIVGGIAVLGRTEDPARRYRVLEAMRQAAARGGRLTQQLLAFARRQALAPESIDLSQRIEGMRELLERSLREDIRLVVAIPSGLWPLQADATQLEVAVLNLAVNARDAMPRGGTLRIQASNDRLSQHTDPDGLAGEFVRISVSDTGIGMAPEVLSRVFEPFFTTKERGRGTGLGLAQVYGFVRQSGGTVRVESQLGQGTTVHLLLPRAKHSPSLDSAETLEPELPRMRQLSVLVVEDDEEVGTLAVELLRQLGHVATRVAGAQAALGALANGRPVDLLFTDVVMPGPMDGLDLAAEARRRRPGLPVLLVSGYAGSPARVAAAGFRLLRKPYGIEDLRAAITATLSVPA